MPLSLLLLLSSSFNAYNNLRRIFEMMKSS